MNEITRPLEVIETEINFYKQQTATGIIEIGKRLIEAKSLLQHGEWGKWLEDRVEFSDRTARQFMKVASEFEGNEIGKRLPISKLYALLDVPQDQREEFVENNDVESLTTRQLQEEIKKLKEDSNKEIEKLLKEKEQEYIKKEKEISEKNKELETKLKEINSDINKKVEELAKKSLEIKLAEDNAEKKHELKLAQYDYESIQRELKDAQLKKDEILKDKDNYQKKYNETLEELKKKNELVTQFMGNSTNFELIKNTSENTLKMLQFVKEMSKYDYLSEVFNDIPDATRREYVRGINAVYKWAKNILNTVRHDDVIGVNSNYIDVNESEYNLID